MHTFTGKKFSFHFNPDLSGDVGIQETGVENSAKWVGGADIRDFIAEIIRRNKISELEKMEAHELINL